MPRSRHSRPRRPSRRFTTGLHAVASALLLGGTVGCSDSLAPSPGLDTDVPVPIDVAPGPEVPNSYKGLPLRLTDTGAPTVTPVDGVIGVVCVGMSNGRIECNAWIEGIESRWAGAVSPEVRLVNCNVGGHAIERWIDPGFDDALWNHCRDRRVPGAGLRPEQIRVIVHKAANQFAAGDEPAYPHPDSDYHDFRAHLSAFAARVPAAFPSVQAVYTSSRSYGGWGRPARGEPLSYEEGHALNTWLADNGALDGVWYGWGPYLWAPECGIAPTNAEGHCYLRDDYRADGVHPSETGAEKIAGWFHDRFMSEAWYRR